MPELSDVKIKISTDSDTKGVDEAEKKILGFSEKAQKSFLAISGMVAGAAVAVGAFAVSTISDFEAQEDALARLHQGLINVTDDTDETNRAMKELGDQASALQKTTRFADEMINSGQAMLTTFMLSKESIKTLTPSMLDMAEAFRKNTGETLDLSQVAVMFGKVMGGAKDGIDGLATGLRKMGVIMTDEQQAVFKFGTEAERASTLTQIMNQNFGGFAEAGGKTFSGRMEIMKNQFGEIKEAIGGMMANALTPLVDFLSANLVPTFQKVIDFFSQHRDIAIALALVLGTIVTAAFIALGVAAVTALSAITIAGAPIFLLIASIGLAIAGLYLIWATYSDQIIAVVNSMVSWFMTYVWPTLQKIFGWLGALFTTLGQIATNIFNLIIKPLLAAFVGWFNTTFWLPLKALFDLITLALNKMGLSWSDVWNGIKKLVFGILEAVVNEVKSKINFVIGAINLLIKGANMVGGKISGYTKISEIPMLASGVTNFRGGMAIVGENGPEIVNLPRGTNVIPNSAPASSALPAIQVTQHIYGDVDMDAAFRQLAYAVATS